MDIISVGAIGILILVLALGTAQTDLAGNPVTGVEEVLMEPSLMDLAEIFQEKDQSR